MPNSSRRALDRKRGAPPAPGLASRRRIPDGARLP